MARAAKKQNMLTPEEKLAQALVPEAEWPYQVPENWCWIRIRNLCVLRNGRAFKPKEWSETGLPIVRIQNLNNPESEYNYYSGEVEEDHMLYGGELLFAWSGTPGTSFGAYIWNGHEAVLNQHIFRVDINEEYINKAFIMYAINQQLEMLISAAHGGAGLQHVTKGVFESTPIVFPPYREQQRIVDCIKSLFAKLDEAKEKAQAVVDGFEDRKAAILHKAFSGEITEEWREKNNTALKSWITESIKESCTIGSGGTPSRKNADYYHGDIPWVKTGEIDWNDLYDTEEHISQAAIDNSSAKVFPEESILVAMYGMGITRGRAAILKVQAATNQAVCVLQPKKHLLNRYLYYYFMCNYKDIRAQAVGGNQLNLSGTIISKLVINIPTIPEQLEIIRVLDILLKKEQEAKEVAEEIIVQIDSIKKSILVRAFRGELGTNDPDDESAVELLKNIIL